MDWDSILSEVSYKLPKGYPTVDRGVFTEINEVLIINEALQAEGLPTLPLPETILLRESDTDIKEVTVCIAADLCNLFGSAMAKALEAFAADKNAVPNEIFQIAKVVNGKDLAKGKKDFAANSVGAFIDFNRMTPESFQGKLVELFDPMQGDFVDQYGKVVSASTARKLFSTDTLFFNQHFW